MDVNTSSIGKPPSSPTASSTGGGSLSNARKKKTSFTSLSQAKMIPSSPASTSGGGGKDHLFFLEQRSHKTTTDATSTTSSEKPTQEYQTIHSIINFDHLNIDFDDFYNEKVNSFHIERQLFDHYLNLIEPKKDQSHQLIWYNRNVIDQIQQNEIEQKEINQKMAMIQKEIDNMDREIMYEQEQKQIRKERIDALESLGRPVEPDVTYIIPERFSKTSSTVHAIARKAKEEKLKNTLTTTPLTQAKSAFLKLAKSGEILVLEKTLQSETFKLHSLLQEITQKIALLSSEKHTLEEQFLQVTEKEFQESHEYYEIVKETEFQSFYLIQELLSLKYRIWVAQRKEMEELEQLVKDRQYFQEKENELKEKLLREMNHTKKTFKDELDDCTREFERQLNELNLQMKSLSHQYATLRNTKVEFTNKEEKLLELLASTKERYSKLQRRYRLEMEGYQTEISFLKKKLQGLQKIASNEEKEQAKALREKRNEKKKGTRGKESSASFSKDVPTEEGEFDTNDTIQELNSTASTIEEDANTSNTQSSSDSLEQRQDDEEGDGAKQDYYHQVGNQFLNQTVKRTARKGKHSQDEEIRVEEQPQPPLRSYGAKNDKDTSSLTAMMMSMLRKQSNQTHPGAGMTGTTKKTKKTKGKKNKTNLY